MHEVDNVYSVQSTWWCYCWLFSRNFLGAKFIVMQISIIMLMFLLFSDQISSGGKSLWGGQTAWGGHLPALLWKKVRLGSLVYHDSIHLLTLTYYQSCCTHLFYLMCFFLFVLYFLWPLNPEDHFLLNFEFCLLFWVMLSIRSPFVIWNYDIPSKCTYCRTMIPTILRKWQRTWFWHQT